MDIEKLISEMTLEEKASLLSGEDFWHTKAVERLGIPAVMVSDGPHGLRKQDQTQDNLGVNDSIKAVCFPPACATACSFDKDLMEKVGEALADSAQHEKLAVDLGPAVNIKRSPLCGRNFEYQSEDPYLAGMMGISETTGVQSHPGIGVTIKHFYGNDQEDNRTRVNNTISERASREIYLKQFEMVVKGAQPMAIMSSYNLNNGIPDADDYDLLTNVTRGEWGFEGLVMTDWGGGQSTPSISMHAGNDLIMPGSSVEDITIRAFTDQEPAFAEDDIYPEVTVSQGWFGLNASAFMAEIFRAGIQAIDYGQMEAARSLGLSYGQTMRKIILPQAFKIMIPSLMNQFISSIKDTAILSAISASILLSLCACFCARPALRASAPLQKPSATMIAGRCAA